MTVRSGVSKSAHAGICRPERTSTSTVDGRDQGPMGRAG